jgi:CheY-like chemotaxis protein
MAGRVLIVEDDALVRMMTADVVEECGLSVVEASSPPRRFIRWMRLPMRSLSLSPMFECRVSWMAWT